MSRIVFIDGENLLYGLRRILGTQNERASRDIFESYDFIGLLNDILSDEPTTQILWFGAKLRQYDQTPELLQKTQKAIRLQAKMVNNLQRQKIQFIKTGYLRARESDACLECGRKEWKLQEKGVDVGLAVRMMQEANDSQEIILMSADTDLLPAIKVSKKLKAKIMFIGYEYQPIAALSQQADSTRLITKPQAQKFLGKVK